MKKIVTIFILLIIILLGGYIFLFQTDGTQNVLNKTRKLLGTTEEALKTTPIQDLITDKPDEQDFIENTNLYTAAWIPYWDESRGFETFFNNSEKLHSISPTWFCVNSDSTLTERNSTMYHTRTKQVHDLGGLIIPTITNPSANELSLIINNDNSRKKHVDEIVAKVSAYKFDGIDIDYENLEAADRSVFSTFVTELGTALHEQGKLLTIAVLPKSDNIIYQFSASRQAQDWEAIGKAVDEFRIMGYDWTHNSTTDPGPISPTHWLEEILNYAIAKVPPEKIVLGLPLYGYYWQQNGVTALTWEQAHTLTEQHNTTPIWDTVSFENKLIVDNSEAWYHDHKSIEKRRRLAQNYGIKGVVYWRLGGEDPDIWQL